jgi:hypothetical protein
MHMRVWFGNNRIDNRAGPRPRPVRGYAARWWRWSRSPRPHQHRGQRHGRAGQLEHPDQHAHDGQAGGVGGIPPARVRLPDQPGRAAASMTSQAGVVIAIWIR